MTRRYETVEVNRDGAAVKIALNRPERMNAWSEGLSQDLLTVLREVAADETVRAVMLTGNGRAFCSGADLKDGADDAVAGKLDTYTTLTRWYHPIVTTIRQMPKPVLTAVNGPAAGAGPALDDWATWCAFAEVHGPDYRTWPVPLRDPRSAETYVLRGDLSTRVDFHVWVQWLVADQMAAAQASARAAGMPIGIVGDLAVGAHPGGAEAWAGQHLYVPGFSVGAPPDEFNQRGQDWTLMPPHPGRLAALSYRPLADLVASAFGLAPDGAALGAAPSAGG